MSNTDNTLEYLRAQRTGTQKGGFAELLTRTYNYLKEQIDKSGSGYCNPYNSDICKVVYGNTYHDTMIKKFLYKLTQLGYISIKGSGENRKITILKELDF